MSDIVLVTTVLGPTLETTEICVSSEPKTYRAGRWSVNGEDCGLVDASAVDSSEENGGCTADQIKPPRDGACYDPILHNLAFLEGETSTRCDNSSTCDNVSYMKNEDQGMIIPDSATQVGGVLGAFEKITILGP